MRQAATTVAAKGQWAFRPLSEGQSGNRNNQHVVREVARARDAALPGNAKRKQRFE